MGKTLLSASNAWVTGTSNEWHVSTASTSWFLTLNGGYAFSQISTANEARAQIKMPAAGTLRNLSVYVSNNARTTATTVKTRINSATGNNSVSFGSGVTGRQTDTTHTDAVAAGDLVNLIITTSTGAGDFCMAYVQIEWETTSGTTTVFSYAFDPTVSLSAAQVDQFPVDGCQRFTIWNSPVDDFRNSRCYVGCAGTLSNLRAIAVTQSMNINPTVEIYKNGSATGVKVTLTAAGTFEDAVNTVAVAVGDYIQFKTTTTGRSSGSLVMAQVSMAFTSSDSKTPRFSSLFASNNPTNVGYATGTNYGRIASCRIASTTEAAQDMLMTFACNVSRFQAGWINNSGSNETMTLRKNAADTASVLTFANAIAGTTNTVDSSNTTSYAANDTLSTKAVTGSATSGPLLISMVIDSATSNTETGTATMALSGISFSAAGARSEAGTGALVLTKISYTVSGARKETSTGGLALSKISYTAAGKRGPAGHATMALSGVSIVALGINAGTAGHGVRQMWTY